MRRAAGHEETPKIAGACSGALALVLPSEARNIPQPLLSLLAVLGCCHSLMEEGLQAGRITGYWRLTGWVF